MAAIAGQSASQTGRICTRPRYHRSHEGDRAGCRSRRVQLRAGADLRRGDGPRARGRDREVSRARRHGRGRDSPEPDRRLRDAQAPRRRAALHHGREDDGGRRAVPARGHDRGLGAEAVMDRDAKIAEAFLAPVGCVLPAHDTRIVDRDGWYQVITPSSGSTLGNEVVYSRLAAADTEAAITRTIADYAVHRL